MYYSPSFVTEAHTELRRFALFCYKLIRTNIQMTKGLDNEVSEALESLPIYKDPTVELQRRETFIYNFLKEKYGIKLSPKKKKQKQKNKKKQKKKRRKYTSLVNRKDKEKMKQDLKKRLKKTMKDNKPTRKYGKWNKSSWQLCDCTTKSVKWS